MLILVEKLFEKLSKCIQFLFCVCYFLTKVVVVIRQEVSFIFVYYLTEGYFLLVHLYLNFWAGQLAGSCPALRL